MPEPLVSEIVLGRFSVVDDTWIMVYLYKSRGMTEHNKHIGGEWK